MDLSKCESINPYAPSQPLIGEPSAVPSNPSDFSPPSINQLIFRWTLVCGFAAAPSFVMGYDVSGGQVTAMLLGILCFIVLYVVVDHSTRDWRWKNIPLVRRVLVFCYATRIVISIVYPLGVSIDLLAGIVSFTVVGAEVVQHDVPDGSNEGRLTFLTTLLTTLVQGVVLNVVLAVWALLTFVVVMLYRFARRLASRRRPVS